VAGSDDTRVGSETAALMAERRSGTVDSSNWVVGSVKKIASNLAVITRIVTAQRKIMQFSNFGFI